MIVKWCLVWHPSHTPLIQHHQVFGHRHHPVPDCLSVSVLLYNTTCTSVLIRCWWVRILVRMSWYGASGSLSAGPLVGYMTPGTGYTLHHRPPSSPYSFLLSHLLFNIMLAGAWYCDSFCQGILLAQCSLLIVLKHLLSISQLFQAQEEEVMNLSPLHSIFIRNILKAGTTSQLAGAERKSQASQQV